MLRWSAGPVHSFHRLDISAVGFAKPEHDLQMGSGFIRLLVQVLQLCRDHVLRSFGAFLLKFARDRQSYLRWVFVREAIREGVSFRMIETVKRISGASSDTDTASATISSSTVTC
jgi:hypothetical protein